ncbi:serine/threonine-protein kinase RsbT [Rhodoblastus acidophilus]|uniref:ATP-binding protein n=1 Tax=Rhodoblastus acidophilus TaxID=1074 RepID=UPI002225093E|nr:ATP-binding protein [Rhodoblastus acidophilus]MCW2284105.1 serine/threonine-protein kinase RsbT [Rhodoblastus acidophilus]MCW2332801.1 serine/threonine-protein kinase RsbT [Rhodoblastus acidophilus]
MTAHAPPPIEAAVPLARREDILTARKTVRAAARALRLGAVDEARVVTIVSELAKNACVHAGAGEVRVGTRHLVDRDQILIEVEDAGPGFSDVSAALAVGFSTNGGQGLGLPAVNRLAKSLTIDTRPGKTLVAALFETDRA